MTDLLSYENELRNEGYNIICGVDEAGRGPLAGPVFAAAVILPPNVVIEGLNDSKKLSEKKREELFNKIIDSAVAYSIALCSEGTIDEINILNATMLAMKKAGDLLNVKPDIVLIDGNRAPKDMQYEARTIVKGDSKCACIAAASILAKVSRDRYMVKLSEEFPQYEFAKHKGYPTKLHYDKINEYGISRVHRRSFLKNLVK